MTSHKVKRLGFNILLEVLLRIKFLSAYSGILSLILISLLKTLWFDNSEKISLLLILIFSIWLGNCSYLT